MDASGVQRGSLVARLTVVAVLLSLGSSLAVLLASASAAGARVPSLRWVACRGPGRAGFECATARVPLDYRDPGGAMIRLAVIRHRATDPAHRLGTLFINSGGPAATIPEFVLSYAHFPAAWRARFDFVTWDPRGTGESTPVRCFASQKQEDRFFAGVPIAGTSGFPVGRAQMQAWIRRYREFGRRCGRRNGRLLEHVSTADIARDMDLLRRAVGARMINYVGVSYGTFLGATYANLFPGRVRAMVLDGNVNPMAWANPQLKANRGRFLNTWLRERADQGAAKTLGAFLDLCGRVDTARCAFSAGGQAATRARWASLLRRLPTQPTAGKTGYAQLVSYTATSLYTVSRWRGWAQVLQQVWMKGKPSTPLPSPSAAGLEEGLAIICSESPNPPPTAFRAQDAFTYRRSGAVGRYWSWGAEPCASWPASAADRYAGPWNHRTAHTVLVVNNTYDPATPYENAVTMSRLLARARLLTVEGYGHVALSNGSACESRYVSRYLIDGSLPPKGARCQQDQQPFTTSH